MPPIKPNMTPPLPTSPAWQALALHAKSLARVRLSVLFEQEPGRAERLCWTEGDLALDLSKQRIVAKTLELLLDLARECQLRRGFERLFAGETVNRSEARAALHPALRGAADADFALNGKPLMKEVLAERQAAMGFAEQLRRGDRRGAGGENITDLLVVGIGGSYLGPALAVEALAGGADGPVTVHFLTNEDGGALDRLLRRLRPERSSVLIVSKSFNTAEVRRNAAAAIDWLRQGGIAASDLAHHLAIATARPEAAAAFDPSLADCPIFRFWDWVGGRYSLWSTAGLPIAVAHGADAFERLLAGARQMDAHLRQAPLDRSLPILAALVDIWNVNLLGASALVFAPYDSALALLPAYLQQLMMESNGKSVDQEGRALALTTVPAIWGGIGSEAQHAFFQALHQGTSVYPVEFLGTVEDRHGRAGHHQALMAAMIAQGEALMIGRETADPAGTCKGDRPSTTILLQRLDAFALGQLLAFYEHRATAQGLLWGINSFDQWGVELGKSLAGRIAREISGENSEDSAGPHDGSTAALIRRIAGGSQR